LLFSFLCFIIKVVGGGEVVNGLEALKNIRRLLINDYQYLADTIEKDLLEHEELKKEIIGRQETEKSITKWVSELTNELEGLKEAQNDK
jgi:hypothetical protein